MKDAGGPYDGFLLSTANVFAPQLAKMISLFDGGAGTAACAIASDLQEVVSSMFRVVGDYAVGNAFCNVNKALDHCFAYGHRYSLFSDVGYLV